LRSRYWATIWLSLAAIGVWALSLWLETRWPWLSLDRGGPWPQAFSSPWKKAWVLWLLYWGGLSGYWALRIYLRNWKPRMAIVLAGVGVLHLLLYFTLWMASRQSLPAEMGEFLSLLANHRLFGLYVAVVRMRLPSFVVGGASWLVFTEFSAWVIPKLEARGP